MGATLISSAASMGASTITSIEVATGKIIGQVRTTPLEEIPAMVERARAARKKWAARSIHARAAALLRFREVVYQRRGEIAALVSRETGKPRAEAVLAEVMLALDAIEFFTRRAPEWLRAERVAHHNVALKAKRGWLEYEPYGVVALISPWNFPFAIPVTEMAPALVGGECGDAEAVGADAGDGRVDW